MINVTYNNWDKWYEKILSDFNFKREDDEYCARILNSLVDQIYSIDVHGKDKCIIFGAGPSIKKHISLIKRTFDIDNYILIASDGATTALNEEGIIPDIIVTDLDGKIDDIIYSNKHGSTLYVHAHGDNIEKIKKYVPKLENVIPTTQSNPVGTVKNYGGFTDGDRAVHIAVYALKMKTIILAGMDFGKYTTRYSRPNNKKMIEKADDFKKLKLDYAQTLIDELIKNNPQVKFKFLN